MNAIILRTAVNSIAWIMAGIVVLILRASVSQGALFLVWEIFGAGLIIYGAGKLVWALVRTSATDATSV